MPEFKVHVRREANAGIITTEGYIDAEGGNKILEACDTLIKEGIHHLILNLEKSHVINSTGIMCLIELADKATEAGGGVFFCCISSTVTKTFRIMGLSEISSLFDTEEEALQAIGSSK